MHPYLEVCCGKALLFIIIATELFRDVKSKRQNGGKIPLRRVQVDAVYYRNENDAESEQNCRLHMT